MSCVSSDLNKIQTQPLKSINQLTYQHTHSPHGLFQGLSKSAGQLHNQHMLTFNAVTIIVSTFSQIFTTNKYLFTALHDSRQYEAGMLTTGGVVIAVTCQ